MILPNRPTSLTTPAQAERSARIADAHLTTPAQRLELLLKAQMNARSGARRVWQPEENWY